MNPKYIDKNYAGIFIVWDRLFGTFQEEEDEPVYGTVKPLASFNPLWANVALLGRDGDDEPARAAARWTSSTPGSRRPSGGRASCRTGAGTWPIPEVSRETRQKYAVPVSRGVASYVGVHFTVVAAATAAMLLYAKVAPPGLGAVFAAARSRGAGRVGGAHRGEKVGGRACGGAERGDRGRRDLVHPRDERRPRRARRGRLGGRGGLDRSVSPPAPDAGRSGAGYLSEGSARPIVLGGGAERVATASYASPGTNCRSCQM